MPDTIFAPISVVGKGSVCIIRISGQSVFRCLDVLNVRKKIQHREASLCRIFDTDGSHLDDALITYFKAPNSFTGEDVCEIGIHSSRYLANKLFSILSNIDGVRMAERGEFSKRAFLNGKMDLLQAESIADLINSETKLQHKKAIEQLEGKNSEFFSELRNDIMELLSNLEAFIDFPEDDIDKNLFEIIREKINIIINCITHVLNDNNVGQKIRDGINISIIGKPNVGKSSFLNFLANENVAIVSEIAGTTRDVIKVSLDIGGIPITFSDTAGIRETNDEIEYEGVKRALYNAKNSDFIILILEPSNIGIDDSIKEFLDEDSIIILNKSDLASDEELKQVEKIYPNIIKISVKYGINTNYVIKYIEEVIDRFVTPYTNTNITHERYRKELEEARELLIEIKNINNFPIEIVSENIRHASFCLGRIIGKISAEDILDNIFSKFCIGK